MTAASQPPAWISGRELLAARAYVSQHHPVTPLRELAGTTGRVYVKCENETDIGSFKARGALWSLAKLAASGATGVVTASTGNHGQGVAFAARKVGLRAVIVAASKTAEVKLRRMEALGAEVRLAAGGLDAAENDARKVAAAEGLANLVDGEDAALMAGAATVAWEVLLELPETDAIVVPVGGGNLLAATALIVSWLSPGVRVTGVQSAAAPAVALSFERGEVTTAQCKTFAGGLATSRPGSLAFSVLRDRVDSVHLVTEDDMRREMAAALRERGALIEGAAAAAFALYRSGELELGKRTTVLIQTGGNVDASEVAHVLSL